MGALFVFLVSAFVHCVCSHALLRWIYSMLLILNGRYYHICFTKMSIIYTKKLGLTAGAFALNLHKMCNVWKRMGKTMSKSSKKKGIVSFSDSGTFFFSRQLNSCYLAKVSLWKFDLSSGIIFYWLSICGINNTCLFYLTNTVSVLWLVSRSAAALEWSFRVRALLFTPAISSQAFVNV